MLSELCVRRPVFATMLVMSLVVLGIFSFRDLGVDLFPKRRSRQVNVPLSCPAPAPTKWRPSVVEPMEETLSSISGIDEMSVAAHRRGQGADHRQVRARARHQRRRQRRPRKGRGAMRNVPPQMLPPIITKVDPDSDPVMSIVVSSEAMSLRTLTEIADKQVKRAIETVSGVGEVDLGGGRAREIHIVVDIDKLNAYGLSMTQVRDAVVDENIEIPGGTVEQGKGELLLRTLGRIDATDDFNNIVVATKNGTPIRVSDLGYAEDSTERPTRRSGSNGSQAVLARRQACDGREHGRRDRGRASAKLAVDPAIAAQGGQPQRHARRLEIHLRVGRVARRASALGQPLRRHRRHVLHPQHPRGDHLGAGHSRVDHLHVHADAGDGLHAEQHDAARHHARRRHRHRRRDRRAREHLPATSRRSTARRSKRRSRARARWRWP